VIADGGWREGFAAKSRIYYPIARRLLRRKNFLGESRESVKQ
jgi:hypothetical protein